MFVSSIKKLEYDRIDISEDIDMNKTSASKECHICCYWYFLDKKFYLKLMLLLYLLKEMIIKFVFDI